MTSESEDRWQISFMDHDESTEDGGSIMYVCLRRCTTGMSLSGVVVRYDEDPRCVDTILRNDLRLPTAVTRRLLGKIYDAHIRLLGDCGACGFDAIINLSDFIRSAYDSYESPKVLGLIESSVLSSKRGQSNERIRG